jgi:hypothetical protein
MSTTLLPQVFWFRLSLPCRRVDGLPRSKGRLLDLPETCALPATRRLEGQEPWAEVRVAWNPGGLAVAVEVTGKPGPIVHDPLRPDASDSLHLWVDTRDTRNIHRASRFCHTFSASLIPSGRKGDVSVALAPKKIHRALADAPLARPETLVSRAERLRAGWRLEVFLPASALNGFDPDTNRRLGFSYQVTCSDRGDQFLTVGREFPFGDDPSLWATLELQD